MEASTLAVLVPVYGLAWWLGLYLLGRDLRSPRLSLSGAGLVLYALALAADLLARDTDAGLLERLRWSSLLLPAVCWTGSLVHLLPEQAPGRHRLLRLASVVLPALGAALLVFGLVLDPDDAARHRSVLLLAGIVVLLPMLALVGAIWTLIPPGRDRVRSSLGAPLAGTLFLALSSGLVVASAGWLDSLPRTWVLLLVGVDLGWLGVAIARFDALDQGETLIPDIVRSFDAALLTALLFGGQVALVMAVGVGISSPMVGLLLATVATAVAIATMAGPVGSALDRVALNRFPGLRRTRTELRDAAGALPRLDPRVDLAALDDEEFVRLTRRAFSHFGDLPRLAANPLIHLPLIDRRLVAQGAPGGGLGRAAELKLVLAEGVDRLKPAGAERFGTSDEWRFYNALYFPYIAGLKPYSRRFDTESDDPVTRQALSWFRTSVPERTLHNWQTTAARLIADDLRDEKHAAR